MQASRQQGKNVARLQIIYRRRRRVAALIIHGDIPDLDAARPAAAGALPRICVGALSCARSGWQPPYPYPHTDVMIEAEEERALDREGE